LQLAHKSAVLMFSTNALKLTYMAMYKFNFFR